MEEIGGLARQYDQDFFKEMEQETGVDLENIVYYKDEVNLMWKGYIHLIAALGSLLCDDR